jgi:hypothetical protein
MVLRNQFRRPARSRKTQIASKGLLWAVATTLGFACAPVSAAGVFSYNPYGDGGFFGSPREDSGYFRPPPQYQQQARSARKRSEAKKVEGTKVPEQKPAGPLIIAVSIGSQHVTVYDNGEPVASAPISTGMKGHPTPTGVFSIIQKEKWHESNLYSNAPMPFMERITWSGVALHAGVLPGYPASHGCIRLPHEFAVRLYGMTRIGARVVVTGNDIAPFEIDHPRLAELLKKPSAAAAPDSGPQDAGKSLGAAAAATPASAKDAPDATATPLGGAGPAAATGGAAALAADAAKGTTRLDFIAETGRLPELRPAFNMLAEVSPLRPISKMAEPAAETATAKRAESQAQPVSETQPVDAPAPLAGPLLRPGPISLFISRKEGKLFVRKGFEPVFDMPVAIDHPDAPIGTHVFTAAKSADGAMRWLAVSIANESYGEPEPARARSRSHGAHEERPVTSGVSSRQSARDALDRVTLPPEALERIAPLMTAGASLVMADQGLGPETGKETDFIVLTR